MTTARDIAQWREGSRKALTPSQRNQITAMQNQVFWSTNPLEDPYTDTVWGMSQGVDHKWASNYFDYYFTGQDVLIYIDGADDSSLPLYNMGFNIEQQKTPVYGFWNYTYNTMMRGTRLVNGQFSLLTTHPTYLKEKLAEAAKSRAERNTTTVMRDVTGREEQIEKYWAKNLGDDISQNKYKHIFSSHPPFNLIIVYGIQSSSVVGSPTVRQQELTDWLSNGDHAVLYTDTNERLVYYEQNQDTMRFVIEACDIVSMQSAYGSEGDVCMETYNFIARDIY